MTLCAGAKENVATAGTWNIHPNVYNAVPRGASILFDIRDVDHGRRQKVIQAALDGANAIAKKRKVDVQAEVVYAFPPVTSNDKVALQGSLTSNLDNGASAGWLLLGKNAVLAPEA